MSSKPSPLPDATASHSGSHTPDPGDARRIGPYRILEKLGEGGMGAVYLAEQTEPVRRRVALKLIRPGMDSAQVVARFEAERQALALMDHPNIAKVLDAGTTDDGQPYFVMELVKGVPITKFCDDARLTIRDRAALFVSVCRAIQHAHMKGIIHRDIKPSNVLVTLVDGKPVAKVIDFGVAKAVDQPLGGHTVYTQIGSAVGTWEYMSPEQAEGSALGVDTRSDVYSLGVLLYELLTGTTPLQRETLSGGFTEVLRMIRDLDPPAPSARLSTVNDPAVVASRRRVEPTARLAKLVRGELDWIALKALAKDRGERYDSANEFADDVQRYLDGDRVKAVPPSVRYRFKKFLRRNKGAVATGCTVLVALALGIVVSTWQATRASQERDRAVVSQRTLRSTLTRQMADHMEADLMRLSAVGEALAATVELGDIKDEKRLIEWKLRMLRSDPHISGLSVQFEPDTFDLRPDLRASRVRPPASGGPDRDGYTLYVYRRRPTQTVVIEPLTSKYNYRIRDWYLDCLSARQTGWVEPSFDDYAGGVPMVSYIAPVRGPDGRITGVLTVELSLEYFEGLGTLLNNPNFGPDSYGFVLSGTGRVVAHPRARLSGKEGEKCPRIDELFSDSAFAPVAEKIIGHSGNSVGEATGVDPSTGRQSLFLYAKFKPGWYFVAVVPEEQK